MKKLIAKNMTRGLHSVCHTVCGLSADFSAASWSSTACSAFCCAVVSQGALCGRSTMTKKATMPTTTAIRPSMRNIHSQPLRPAMPFMSSSAPEIGPPMTSAPAKPNSRMPLACARTLAGNQ
ncbi:hypothetical protein D3C72_2012000 [compost metagenome]